MMSRLCEGYALISSHPRWDDPGEPLDICTTTFTKPRTRRFFGDPATKEQKQSNPPPIPGLKMATKVHKFHTMPAYVPGVTL